MSGDINAGFLGGLWAFVAVLFSLMCLWLGLFVLTHLLPLLLALHFTLLSLLGVSLLFTLLLLPLLLGLVVLLLQHQLGAGDTAGVGNMVGVGDVVGIHLLVPPLSLLGNVVGAKDAVEAGDVGEVGAHLLLLLFLNVHIRNLSNPPPFTAHPEGPTFSI